jgi:hypothetical protein
VKLLSLRWGLEGEAPLEGFTPHVLEIEVGKVLPESMNMNENVRG